MKNKILVTGGTGLVGRYLQKEMPNAVYIGSSDYNLTKNNEVIKLPSKNYIESLENYINLKNKSSFEKYKIYDYRINNQLILK